MSQSVWIPINNSRPYAPDIELISSTQFSVSFRVKIQGVYRDSKTHGDTLFYRLLIPGGGKDDLPGFPEIPFIKKLVAVPTGSTITTSVQIIDSVMLTNYLVYPAPRLIVDSNEVVEQFTINDSLYNINDFYDINALKLNSTGFIRNQEIAEVFLYPIAFDPPKKTLRIYTDYIVTLNFSNQKSSVNVDMGIINNIANRCLLNYSIPPHPKKIKSTEGTGNVQWATIGNDTSIAHTIVADYLIITDHQFYDN